MCGITGFIDFNGKSSIEHLTDMVKSMKHRGPDDFGVEVYEVGNSLIGLGHARLSIIELSELGHQPMKRENISVVFNGEIYNYKEIQNTLRLKGYHFSSDSDTEVIIHAYKEWGENFVDHLIGMFAFVIIDEVNKEAIFYRDRAGVKPLFVYEDNGLILFSSELKAFHKHPLFNKNINPAALEDYLHLQYVKENKSIYKNVEKVKPGTYCKIDLITFKRRSYKYWSAEKYYCLPKLDIGYEEAKKQLHRLLKSAFGYRMVSDVPVGVFLSGGYDSTALAAILQSNSENKLKTFTIGFEEGNNEAPFARETARMLGTEHFEYTCTTEEAKAIIPELSYYFDEPFGDSSAIPTMLVSKFASKEVTVALSADGGDELFAGYTRYSQLENYLNTIEKVPSYLGKAIDVFTSPMSAFIGQHYSHQLKTMAQVLSVSDRNTRSETLYDRMHRTPIGIVQPLLNPEYVGIQTLSSSRTPDSRDQSLLTDYMNYLPSDILTKVDRATMAASIEGREPLLDHRVFEFAAQLPYEYKMHNGVSKKILKDIVHEYLPKEVMDRPKTGFSIPLTSWLQNDLKEYVNDTFYSTSIYEAGILNKKECISLLEKFHNNKLHYKPLIWKLLMLMSWYDRWAK